MADSKMNGEELTVKCTVAFFDYFEFLAEKSKGAWSTINNLVEGGSYRDVAGSCREERSALGAEKYRVVADARDFLAAMKASYCSTSHRRDFGLPDRAKYMGAMVWVRPGIKRWS